MAGTRPSGLRPDWRPLLALAPDELPDFMWMFRDFLEGEVVVEAYKHSWTRQYLHLDGQGRAYVFLGARSGPSMYEEVDPKELLAEALRHHDSRASIVRQNDWIDGKQISWARSATRHRVPRVQTLYAIQHTGACFVGEPGPKGGPRLYFFGYGEDEEPLEIVAVLRDDGSLLIIHSMPLRSRFEERFTEALRWQR